MVPRSIRRGLKRAWPLTLLLIIAACGGDDKVEVSEITPQMPEQITESYHTRQTRAGVPVWELWGDQAESYPGEDTMLLYGVRMHFYEQGERVAVLTAQSAEVDQVTEFTTARGNVIVVNSDGDQLESEVLHWDPEQRLIHAPIEEFVKFTRDDQILTGYGMDADPELTNVEIQRQFEGDLPGNKASEGQEGR